MAILALVTLVTNTETFAAVGRTVGQFAVSQTGSAQYTIPIWAPPGPRGIQPSISLVYDSRSPIGPIGLGWSIAGLGEITRCNKTVAQDTIASPVALATSDGYCINGNRLRLTSGTYGIAGSTYQTEIADFSNITAVGAQGNGPASFTVQGRNGLTYYYGFTDANGNGQNSQVIAAGSSPSTALTWLLSKVVDRATNNYVINYTTVSGTLSGTAVPNTILWTPATSGSSTYTYKMQFNYTPNVPQSSINKYVGGTLVANPQLLSSIEVLYDNTTVVKDYFLGYQASPTTSREQLVTITECPNTTESSANCLSPTSISYGGPTRGVSTTVNTALSSSGSSLTARYDLNGDGIPDLIYNNGTSWYVSFGSASGYGTPINTGITASIPGFLPGNLNAGTEDGILANNGGTWWYYTWNASTSSFTGVSTTLAFDSTISNYQLADVNGDGLPDLISLDTSTFTSATVDVNLNTTSGTAVTISSTRNAAYTLAGVNRYTHLLTPDTQLGKMRHFDFNGDGRDDLVLFAETTGGPNYTYELISNGATFSATQIAVATGGVYFVDWNDDKCTDFISNGVLYVSGCNGTVPVSYSVGTPIAAMDWDGDGRTDLIVANGSTLGVYLSTGSGISSSMLTTTLPYTSTCQYLTMDAAGGGLDDLGCWSELGSTSITYYLHNGVPDLATVFEDGYGNLAEPAYTSIAQGSYVNMSDAVFPYQNYIGPMYVVSTAKFSDPSKVPYGIYAQTYTYTGAWINLQGRGFQGFLNRSTVDSRTALYETQYYLRTFPYTGMMYEDDWSNGTVFPSISEGNNTMLTLDSTVNNERYFPYFNGVTTLTREVGGPENGDLIATTLQTYGYDNYGNATGIVTKVTDNDPGSPYNGQSWTATTTNTTDISANQSADVAAWCLNMLDETQVVYSSTLSGSTSVTRTKTFTPDTPAECRIKTIVTEPTANSGLYKVTEGLTFDSFGNVYTDTVTGANMPSSPASRLTTLNWGTTGQFLNSLTDPSGAVTTRTYTSSQSLTFGVPDSQKNANNLTTSWVYDGFGRKTKETRPDGTSTGWAWSTCTSYCGWSNSVYQIAQTAYQNNGTTVIRTDTTSYDPIDRVTQSAGPTVTGATTTVQTLYNPMGLVAQRSMPFLSGTPYQQTYGYDVLNRLTSVTRPISATNANLQSTVYAYTGRALAVSDPYGHTKTTVTDVNGWLRQAKDPIGYNITRTYDSAGSLLGITDSVGNTLLKNVTYNYGIKPFLVAATDADRGAWTYTVDSLGERTAWTDAKEQSFSMTYDALSRPLTRTEPDLFSQWTWGSTPSSYNVGQLIAECAGAGSGCATPTYSESRTFDSYGRLYQRAITEAGNPGNDPGGAFLFTDTYSATTGLLSTLKYPISTSSVALTLQYGYGYGILSSVTDTSDTSSTCGSSCVLWTANAMNSFGQVTQETLGNGVVTNRRLDAVTSWLTGATAGVGGGAALLNQSYLQDENGNVTQRQDGVHSLTENFFYDADNRLTCATLASSCATPTFVYDGGNAGPGNITTQVGVGTYTYPAAGQPRPHAVSSITGTFNGITNPPFSYDANGNMTDRASTGANIAWRSSNYPSSISATDATGSENLSISYGPDRQRVGLNYNGPSGYTTAYYVGGLIDLVFTAGVADYRHYIYAGNEPIAVYSRTAAGAITMRYMLEDHQGGVSAITSNAGATDVDESFSAFGNRRNPTTWSGAPTTTDLNTIASISRQGYTFQTALGQSMGLNHMNGRVQDAILGRFLSPDPHITDPSNAQSYNRYSYVDNSPLSYTDPTGFKKCPRYGGCEPVGGFQIPGGLPSSNGSPDGDYNPSGSGAVVTIPGTLLPIPSAFGLGPDNSGSDAQGTAQSQTYICGPCAPAQSMSSGQTADYQIDTPITVTSQNPNNLSPVTTTAFYMGFGSVTGGGSTTTSLFRAVSPAELASIKGLGTFTNPAGIESKYFSTTLGGAQSYAAQAEAAFGDEPYSFVGTSMPTSEITPEMVVEVDGGIRTVVVPTGTLPSLSEPFIIIE
jgi:RHS repeat-associated protein